VRKLDEQLKNGCEQAVGSVSMGLGPKEKTNKEYIQDLLKGFEYMHTNMQKLQRLVKELQRHSHDTNGNVVSRVETDWYF
jgi:hypothetical protein